MRHVMLMLLFALVVFTWGTTWMAMKIAVTTIPPIFATGLRFFSAAPILLLLAWQTKTPILFPPGQRGFQLIVCLAYFSLPFTLMIYGEQFISPALASIIFANMPGAILLASICFLKEKISFSQVIGLVIAVVSLSVILHTESTAAKYTTWRGTFVLILAVIIHAIMYTQCKKRSCNVSVLTFNALPSLGAGIILLMSGWFIEHPNITTFSSVSVYAVLYLGLFAGICGILGYFKLQQIATAFQASTVFLIFPLLAISLENMTTGHAISQLSILLLIPLLLGIFVMLLPGNFMMFIRSRLTSTKPTHPNRS